MTSQTLLEPVRRFVRNKQLIMIILATVTGAAAAFGAVLFRETVVLIQPARSALSRKFDECHSEPARLAGGNGTDDGGLLIGLFVYYFMPGKRGRGVADVMDR